MACCIAFALVTAVLCWLGAFVKYRVLGLNRPQDPTAWRLEAPVVEAPVVEVPAVEGSNVEASNVVQSRLAQLPLNSGPLENFSECPRG